MRPCEKDVVLPRCLAVGNGLDVELRHAVADDRENSVFRVNSVERFRQRESLRPIRKSHRVGAVRLAFPGMKIWSKTMCGGGGANVVGVVVGRVLVVR